MGFWRDFWSNLSFPRLIGVTKHSFQVLLELRLLRGEVLEEEAFIQREKREKNQANKERDKEQRAWFDNNNKQLSWLLIIQYGFF
jgi:hypothetical protein